MFLCKRFIRLIIVILGVTMITFILSHVIPGDPARMLIGQKASQETLDKMRVELGLDQPVSIQYKNYLLSLCRGDMGTSIRTQQPVSKELQTYFPATLELTLVSMFIAVVFGLIFGVVAAINKDKWQDNLCRILSLIGVSTPLFWSGLIVLIIFYKELQILPASGRLDAFVTPPPTITGMYIFDGMLTGNWQVVTNAIIHLILPACCLAYVQLAVIARQVRSTMVEVLEQDYIRTARAFGLPYKKIIFRYALRNALLPALTIAGLTLGELLGGAIITETIFAWPGMGKYVVDSVSYLDFPAIMGFTMVVAISYVLVNLAVDLLYLIVDPQIRRG